MVLLYNRCFIMSLQKRKTNVDTQRENTFSMIQLYVLCFPVGKLIVVRDKFGM